MDLFFFGKYTNTPSADQSASLSALTSNDLQIGIGTADNTGSNVNFAAANMKHVNGLAKIVLGTKTIPLTRTFYITGINQSSSFSATTGGTTYDSKGIAAYMQYYQGQMASDPITSTSAYKTGTFNDADGNTYHFVEDSGSRSVKAAANFEGTTNRPYYHSAQSAYYAILKPSTTSVFYSKDGIANGWGNRITSNRVNASVLRNRYSSYTAQSDSVFINLAASYNYAGKVELFLPPLKEKFNLEVWGAQSGGWGSHVNYPGGYSKGEKEVNETLYVCCGGKGYDKDLYTDGTCYNGGGHYQNIHGGGGATHIATVTGVLKDLANNKSDVLIVAGGAGSNGGWHSFYEGSMATGGGLVGGGSCTHYSLSETDIQTNSKTNTGGGQDGCGTDGIKGGFGYGASATEWDAGNGGGGWYGGNASGGEGLTFAVNGGGGSGYIGGVDNGITSNGVNSGNGKACITWFYKNR